jgi:D-alanyl-D-alanine carboxypeptidase
MKTGYIRRSGFCTTVTCKRGKTRLVAVATGFKSWRERDNFIRKLLDWGFRKTAMNK